MNDIEQILEKTILAAIRTDQTAIADLREVTNSIAHAVINQTRAAARVVLEELNQNELRPDFNLTNPILVLTLVRRESRLNLAYFEIPPAGYPISVSSDLFSLVNREGHWELLTNRIQIESFFYRMVSNPQSALIIELAKLKKELIGKEMETDGVPA